MLRHLPGYLDEARFSSAHLRRSIYFRWDFLFGPSNSNWFATSNEFPVQGFRRFCSPVLAVVAEVSGFPSGRPSTAEDAVFPIDFGDTATRIRGVVIEICAAW